MQRCQPEMYKTGQPCKRNRSLSAALGYAQKSSVNLDEQATLPAQTWALLLFHFASLPLLSLPLVLPHSLVCACNLLCLSSTQSAWEVAGCSNYCQVDFIALLEIIEILKLTSEQGPLVEDVRF